MYYSIMQMQMWHWVTLFGCSLLTPASQTNITTYDTTESIETGNGTTSRDWLNSTWAESTEKSPPLDRPPTSTLAPTVATTSINNSPSTLVSSSTTPFFGGGRGERGRGEGGERGERGRGEGERGAARLLPQPPLPRTSPLTPSQLEQDEYYSAYPDYSENSTPINTTGGKEGVLVPEPEGVLESNRLLIEPQQDHPPSLPSPFIQSGGAIASSSLQVDLPDDSLADTDLHDHDLIDSVMYIYFGASVSDQRAPGRQVLIVGAVVGLVAQFLTLAGGARRVRTKSSDPSLVILINTEIALTVTNLLFMLGVQATGDHCESIAVSLHYLHLVVCCWFSANCLHAYRRIVQPLSPPNIHLYFLFAWAAPAIPTLGCLWLNRDGYETRIYCWMSVERGMMLSFLLPISSLMMLTTGLAVAGLRLAKQDESERRSLRIAASLLPIFSVVWFLGVVALEHSSSLVLPLLFVATSGFLNWFVFICWLPNDVNGWRGSEDDLEDEEDELYDQESAKAVSCLADDQPLLQEVVCGRRPPHDPYDRLQMDPIATISS